MAEKKKKQPEIKKKLDRIKESRVSPWQILLSVILFTGVLFSLPALAGGRSIFDFLAWFYLAMAAVAAVIDAIQGAIPLRPAALVRAFLGYTYRLFMELLLILMALPVIVLTMLLGPGMFLAFFVSLGCLVMYFITVILKIDIKGAVPRESGWEALVELGVLIVSGFLVFNLEKTFKFLDFLLEKVVDAFIFIAKPRPKEPGNQD